MRFFSEKEYSHKKFQRQKKVLCKNSPEFSFESGSKKSRFTSIKTGGIGKPRGGADSLLCCVKHGLLFTQHRRFQVSPVTTGKFKY
jgi:hypothetical protein